VTFPEKNSRNVESFPPMSINEKDAILSHDFSIKLAKFFKHTTAPRLEIVEVR
jgi:hypothetical protein